MKKKLKELLQSLPGYDPFDCDDCWRFDEKLAWHVVDFFHEFLTHTKGPLARTPLILNDWQIAILLNLYGWVHKETGHRRYQQAFIMVPRKNGKSTFIAGMVIYAICADPKRPTGGELYSAATERDQAKLVFNQAKEMVLQNEELSDIFKIYQNAMAIEEEGSSYRPLSSDAKSKHGFNSSFICYDEIQAARDRDLYDVLDTSTGSQDNPLFVVITTSDWDRPSICNELLDTAEKVRTGVIKDDRFLPVIYRADIDDDWTDPEVWKKANPNLGVSIKMDYMEAKCQKAQDVPSFENTFKRLHLNMKTEQAERWLPLKYWDNCKGKLPDLKGRKCRAGLDLASTIDICALELLFEPTEDDPLSYILSFFWVPQMNIETREKKDNVPYVTWASEGYIKTTTGNVADYDVILKDIEGLGEIYEILEIAIDRWGSQNLQNQLTYAGFEVVPFGQGYASMSPACKALEKMVIGVECMHDGNPVLRWMFSNVAIEKDSADNMKFSKKKSTEKIDGMVALAMAIGRQDAKDNDDESPYENGGLFTV